MFWGNRRRNADTELRRQFDFGLVGSMNWVAGMEYRNYSSGTAAVNPD